MEREGSGIDLLFERLLASGRNVPTIIEGTDSVHVTVPRRVVQPGVIRLLAAADQRYQLTQRERITFALVAQTEGPLAVELAEELELADTAALRPWLGRLLTLGLSISPVARTPRAASCRPRSYAKPGSTRPRRSRGFRLAGCARSYLRISTASRTRRRATSFGEWDQRSPIGPSAARSKSSSGPAR